MGEERCNGVPDGEEEVFSAVARGEERADQLDYIAADDDDADRWAEEQLAGFLGWQRHAMVDGICPWQLIGIVFRVHAAGFMTQNLNILRKGTVIPEDRVVEVCL